MRTKVICALIFTSLSALYGQELPDDKNEPIQEESPQLEFQVGEVVNGLLALSTLSVASVLTQYSKKERVEKQRNVSILERVGFYSPQTWIICALAGMQIYTTVQLYRFRAGPWADLQGFMKLSEKMGDPAHDENST